MLKVETIRHRYDSTVSVNNVSFTVGEAEVVSLLGPSGCGKSTLLRLVAGLEQPCAGTIHINDRLVADSSSMVAPEQRGVGMVFQDYALFPHMSVFENVLFGLSSKNYSRLSENERRSKAALALERSSMEDYANAMPHELSGGQQQRVALSRALATDPSLILLDEPYAGLDSRLRERIRDDMLHVLKESGTAVLMVTHDSEEAMFMSDTIVVLRDGEVVQRGRPIDLYCRPNTAFVAEFFGEVNRTDWPVKNGRMQTPLGDFPVSDIPDGGMASLVIRHEALIVDSAADDANAWVVENRLLGRASLLHLTMPVGGGEELHLHARVPGLNFFSVGQRVRLRLDPNQAFVFAKSA